MGVHHTSAVCRHMEAVCANFTKVIIEERNNNDQPWKNFLLKMMKKEMTATSQ